MPYYRRIYHPGGTCFFTVNLLHRNGNDLLTRHIERLRAAVRKVRRTHPFVIDGWVVLPEHLHCVMRLPEGDGDFTTRWQLIKAGFSIALPENRAALGDTRTAGERGI
jgi:putative transposase